MLDVPNKEKFNQIITNREKVVVISHVNPDGDAIGSALALTLFLRKCDVPVSVILPNEVPAFLKWLPGYDVLSTCSLQMKVCRQLISDADVIIMVDFNEPGRLGDLQSEVEGSNAFKILIDHHQHPASFTDILISESWRGSTGEMIYLIIRELGLMEKMDTDIATCLYVAIMTDTGNFRYGSSYSEIFDIAGDLVDYNIRKDEIFTNIYDSYSENRMRLMGYCMTEKLVVMPEYKTAYISLTMKELERYNHQVGDTEGFVNIPFSIKGVLVTALFIEKKNYIKISFRSKGGFSVDRLASLHFNGGGHINAAGGESNLSMEETIQKFTSIITESKNEII